MVNAVAIMLICRKVRLIFIVMVFRLVVIAVVISS